MEVWKCGSVGAQVDSTSILPHFHTLSKHHLSVGIQPRQDEEHDAEGEQ